MLGEHYASGPEVLDGLHQRLIDKVAKLDNLEGHAGGRHKSIYFFDPLMSVCGNGVTKFLHSDGKGVATLKTQKSARRGAPSASATLRPNPARSGAGRA
jgi:hypothetical protein